MIFNIGAMFLNAFYSFILN